MLKNKRAYTLLELVAALAIIIILSVIGFSVYRLYVKKAIGMEGRGMLYDVYAAEQVRRTRHGSYLAVGDFTKNNNTLGVDFRGNKYFNQFKVTVNADAFTIVTNSYEGANMTLIGYLTPPSGSKSSAPVLVDNYSKG